MSNDTRRALEDAILAYASARVLCSMSSIKVSAAENWLAIMEAMDADEEAHYKAGYIDAQAQAKCAIMEPPEN